MSLRERSGQAFSGREKKEGDGERRKQEGSIRADPDPAERWKKGEERISWGKVNRMVSLEERSGFHTEFGLRARPGEHLYQQNQCTSVEYQQLLDQIRQSKYTQSCEVEFGRVWHAHPCPRPHRKPLRALTFERTGEPKSGGRFHISCAVPILYNAALVSVNQSNKKRCGMVCRQPESQRWMKRVSVQLSVKTCTDVSYTIKSYSVSL